MTWGRKERSVTPGGQHHNPRAVSRGAACVSHHRLKLGQEEGHTRSSAQGCGPSAGTAGLLHPAEQWPSAGRRVSSTPVPVLLQVTSHSSGGNAQCFFSTPLHSGRDPGQGGMVRKPVWKMSLAMASCDGYILVSAWLGRVARLIWQTPVQELLCRDYEEAVDTPRQLALSKGDHPECGWASSNQVRPEEQRQRFPR